MERKSKKILQIDVDKLSDEELEEVAGGVMGSLTGCACVCIGDDAEKTASTTLSNKQKGPASFLSR